MDPRTDRDKCVENPCPQKLPNSVFAWEGLEFLRFPASSKISENRFKLGAKMRLKSRKCCPKALEQIVCKAFKITITNVFNIPQKRRPPKFLSLGCFRSGGKGAPRVVRRGLPGTFKGQTDENKCI